MNHTSRFNPSQHSKRQRPRRRAARAADQRAISLPKYLLAGGLGLAMLGSTPLLAQNAQDAPNAGAADVPANTANPNASPGTTSPAGATGTSGDTPATVAGDAAAAAVVNPEVPTGLLPLDTQEVPPPPPEPAPGLGDARLAESEAAPELGVIEAIAQALLNNPSRKEARFALEAARQRIGTARSAGGPQVNASGNATGSRGFFGSGSSGGINTGNGTGGTGTGGNGTGTDGTGAGGTGTGNNGNNGSSNGNNILGFNSNLSAGLSASVPIYNGGRVKASTRVAESNAQAQAARVLQVDQELVLQVSLGYLDVLRADQLLRVAESNLAVSRERRRVAGVRFGAGAAARLEVLRADTTLANAQQSRVASVNALAQSRGALNTLLGRPPETPLRTQSLFSLAVQFGGALPTGAFGLAGSTTPSPAGISGLAVPGATAPIGGSAATGNAPVVPNTGTTGTTGIVPSLTIPTAPGVNGTGATATGNATIPNITGGTNATGTGGTAAGTSNATAPNVSAPGVDVPGSVSGNSGSAGTSIGTGTGAGAAGISVPGVSAPGAGGVAVGGSSGTTSSGTVLTNPAGTTGADSGASTSGANVAGNLTQQAGILSGQSGASLRAAAGGGRQSLAVTQAQIQAAEAAVDVARAQKKPQIDLSLSGFLRSPASFLGRFLLNLGVGIAQNVFDSGRTTAQVREAQATVSQLRQTFAGQQLQVAQQIEQSLLALDSAQRRQSSSDVSVVSAAEALRSAQLGFEAGALTSLDVSDAQTALLTAQINSINTRFDVAQAQATLAASVGVLSPEARAAFQRAVEEEAARINATPIGGTQPAEAPRKKRRKFLGIF